MQSPPACAKPHLKAPGRDQAQRVELVDNLDSTLASGDLIRGREGTGFFVGCATVKADADQISLFYERGYFAASMIKATGTHAIVCGSGGRISHAPTRSSA
jgi:hypothetical protein